MESVLSAGSAGEAYSHIYPELLHAKLFERFIRLDGRDLEESRPVIVDVDSIKSADSSATVRIGNTKVTCGIKAEIGTPCFQIPNQGYAEINCSTSFSHPNQRWLRRNAVASQMLTDLIIGSKYLDLTQLCIMPKVSAWCLYIDCVGIDNSGSMLDAFCIAVIAALRSLKLPKVTIDEDTDNSLIIDPNTKNSLEFKISPPLMVTFGVFSNKTILMDPTLEEETLCTKQSGLLHVSVSADSYSIVKFGGVALRDNQLSICVANARKRTMAVISLLNSLPK